MASVLSPARRVLAQKSTNASLSTRGTNSVEKIITYTSVTLSAGSVRAGQKRRHEEVDNLPSEPYSSQTASTHTLSDGVEDREDHSTSPFTGVTGSTLNMSGSNSTTMSSFHASQASLPPQEEQFEIHEEISQNTLEKLHATPIEQSFSFSELLPEPPSTRPPLTKDFSNLSQNSAKLSTYLDLNQELEDTDIPPTKDALPYDADGDLQTPSPLPRSEQFPKSLPEEQKNMLVDKADMLRTRLQFALYKVQTKQTSRSFAYVVAPRAPSPELPPAPLLLKQAARPYQVKPNRIRSVNSPESKIAAARARATYQTKPPVRNLDSLPVPTIVPTAYSARSIDPNQNQVHVPSSPPPSHSHAHDLQSSTILPRSTTPTKTTVPGPKSTDPPETPVQLSSPPGSDHDDEEHKHKLKQPSTARRIATLEQRGLTSSVAKGEAASGLLELMKAAAAGQA